MVHMPQVFSATENLLLFVHTVLTYSIYELYSAIFKSKNFHRLSPKTFFKIKLVIIDIDFLEKVDWYRFCYLAPS
jgi:hypothetical protein